MIHRQAIQEKKMKRIFLFALLLMTLIFASQVPSFAELSDTSEAAVANLERQYFEALDNQDEALMDTLLAENFVISSMSSGRSMKKEAFLKTLAKQDMTSYEINKIKVDIEEDKANSQVDISMTKTYNGDDHSGNYEVYSVWENKEGDWELVERKIKFLDPS